MIDLQSFDPRVSFFFLLVSLGCVTLHRLLRLRMLFDSGQGIRYTSFGGSFPTIWHRIYAFDQATYYLQVKWAVFAVAIIQL